MFKQLFVTGTDTEVGKTFVSCAILQAANKRGLNTLGLKPIASGCELIGDQWRNEDALALQQNASVKLPYNKINPIALPQAVAPHLAAQYEDVALSVKNLVNHYNALQPLPANLTLIEGAGGWLVPLNNNETYADFVKAINIPVILVVGIRLGCINHALLTTQAIETVGLNLAGWVANCIDPNAQEVSNMVDTLTTRITAPCLGVLPHGDAENAPQKLNLTPLLIE